MPKVGIALQHTIFFVKIEDKLANMANYHIIRILNRLNLLRRVNSSSKIKINSRIMKIPLLNGLGFDNLQMTELWLNSIISKILAYKAGAFIDVGVNLGQTLLKVKSADTSREYYGFEPNPMCYHYAMELVKLNNLKGCNLIPVGLFHRPSLLKLFLNANTDSAACLVDGFRDSKSYKSYLYVPVFEGDYMLRLFNIDSVSLLKIDVEGGELEVIRGLRKTISKYYPYILCEILPVYDESTDVGAFRKRRQDELEEIIREEGYIIHRILRSGEIVRIESIGTHSDLSLCEYLFVHKSAKEKTLEFLEIG
jgi:FkbM family methyltransferase